MQYNYETVEQLRQFAQKKKIAYTVLAVGLVCLLLFFPLGIVMLIGGGVYLWQIGKQQKALEQRGSDDILLPALREVCPDGQFLTEKSFTYAELLDTGLSGERISGASSKSVIKGTFKGLPMRMAQITTGVDVHEYEGSRFKIVFDGTLLRYETPKNALYPILIYEKGFWQEHMELPNGMETFTAEKQQLNERFCFCGDMGAKRLVDDRLTDTLLRQPHFAFASDAVPTKPSANTGDRIEKGLRSFAQGNFAATALLPCRWFLYWEEKALWLACSNTMDLCDPTQVSGAAARSVTEKAELLQKLPLIPLDIFEAMTGSAQ